MSSYTNRLDRIIATVSPATARNRVIARAQFDALDGLSASSDTGQASESKWRGASRILRSMKSWLPKSGSVYADNRPVERQRMISRSYDAYRNHLIAGAAVSRIRTNTVGTGLVPHATVQASTLGITDDEADALNVQIDQAWESWAEDPLESDIEGSTDFYGQQALVLVAALLAGDAFALTPFEQRLGSRWGLKIQLVDGERVCNPHTIPDSPTYQQGIRLDAAGFPVSISIRHRHPGDALLGVDLQSYDDVPIFGAVTGRRRVMHVLQDKDRIGMVRGMPVLAPILEPLQQLEAYGRAELNAAVVSALFTVLLTRDTDEIDADSLPLATLPGLTDIPDEERDGAAEQQIELSTGGIMEIPAGLKPEFVNPMRPNAQYDPFFRSVVSQIGARLEIPADVLMLQYNTSYSAARAAMLEAFRLFSMRRWWLVQSFCEPIRSIWFDEAVARGIIAAPGYADPVRRAAYQSAGWVGPARGSMDEEKEARAAKARIDANLSNETIETASLNGQSWIQVHNTRVRERRIMVRDSVRRAPGAAATTEPPA